MRLTILLFLTIACTLSLNACGHKGKLKTPSQVEADEAKKAAAEKP